MLHVPTREWAVVEPQTGWIKSAWASFFQTLGATYGTWNVVPHAAGDFTGNGAMTWTVQSGDLTTFAYVEMGKLMLIALTVATSSVGGVANTTLQVALPAGRVAARAMTTPAWISDNGTPAIGVVRVTAGGSVLAIQTAAGANWTASANATGVECSLAIEVR